MCSFTYTLEIWEIAKKPNINFCFTIQIKAYLLCNTNKGLYAHYTQLFLLLVSLISK